MKRTLLIDPIVYLQIHISRLFMEANGLSVNDFLILDNKKDILGFLRTGYEIFHLTGDDGILEEIDNYISQ